MPIQFFVYSNGGYGSIRQMQLARFGRVVGADRESGFTMPSLASIAECYRLDFQYVSSMLRPVTFKGQIIELVIDPEWTHYPRVATNLVDGVWQQDSMEDMTPKLPADELRMIMEWDG